MQIKKKALSFLLSAIMGAAMLVALPSLAYADKPDLEFALKSSISGISTTMVHYVVNGQSDSSIFSIATFTDPMTFTIGGTYLDYLADSFTPSYDYPKVLAIGEYLAVLELNTDGMLINYGQQEIHNDLLCQPWIGTTKIVSVAGKVTVSSYEEVYGCQLYLVPSSSLPVAGGVINLKDSIEVTGDGDITGLAVDTYTLYTVYTDSITDTAIGNYNHGAYTEGSSVTVASGPVCRIGSTNYPNLAAALAEVDPGETITLLQSITESTNTSAATSYTIDLAGYSLALPRSDVNVTDTGNLIITGGGSVTVDNRINVDGGILSVEADLISNSDGVMASSGGKVTVTGSIFLRRNGEGVFAYGADSEITVIGNITIPTGVHIDAVDSAKVYVTGNLICTDIIPGSGWFNIAIIASSRGYVELNGNIETNGMALYSLWDSEVYIKGDIDVGIDNAFLSSFEVFSSEVSIDGDVSIKDAFDGNCIEVRGDSNVVIKGDVGVEGERCNAIYAYGRNLFKPTVSIRGSVSVSGSDCTAIHAEAGGSVTVEGDVTTEGLGSRGVYVNSDLSDSNANVGGSVTATGDDSIGIDCFYQGIATVGGNVVASGSNAIGVQVQYSSEVTIEGKITAPTYISFGELTINGVYYNPYTKTAADNDSSSMKPDYMQYSVSYQGEGNYMGDYIDYVWVKNLEIPTPDPGPGPGPGPEPGPGPGPGLTPNPGTPGTGDFDTLLASSLALLFILMGASALVVSRRKVTRAMR